MTTTAALQPKVLIMAGGTGGHVFPALTIAQDLLALGSQVEWLGTRAGLEARVIGNTTIPLHFISVAGLRGKSVLRKLLAPFTLVVAVLQACLLIRRVNPACVLGMGGYVTGPGGVAARLLGKKLLIHEQNAVAGLANVLLFPFAQVAMEGFPGAFARKLGASFAMRSAAAKAKVIAIGNPVRADILAIAAPEQRLAGRTGKLRLLVVGGSLGASVFNQLVPALLATMQGDTRPVVRHQCGRSKLVDTLQYYSDNKLKVSDELLVCEFIDNMAEAYAWADIVLCRAGASTLAELTAIGLPAILVPYPFAADDHQAVNAEHLAAVGAAKVVPQLVLTVESLQAAVLRLGANREQLLAQALVTRKAGIRDASTQAARLCLEACNG
jgi:UDP-N-acetylglucosamine--N-acetylmuramyl-(pentapeptide) pyrophosphoryl-undecaprenol N-acetylglucosamine transferase